MLSMSVRQAMGGFFDRPAVQRAVDSAARRLLSKFGAYVRRSAKRSIRPGGKKHATSTPGEPPRSHVGTLRKLLYFAWDENRKSVVVGPSLFSGAKAAGIPGVLERGGVTEIVRTRFHRGKKQTIRTRAKIAPRPYMGPALEKNIGLLPAMWANSVRAA
jgi:hypothetical protein